MARASVLYPTGGEALRLWLTGMLAVVLACALATGLSAAEPTFPALTGRVVDAAGLLSAADRAALDAELAAHEAKSTDQIVVVTVPSLQGYAIEDYGSQLGRKWGIGQKDKDNGVILIVAPNERKVRIEVGRRLEPLLPDGLVGSIISRTILPAFRRGDFPGGIKAGASQISAVLEGDKAELEQRSKRPPPETDYTAYIIIAIWLIIVILMIRAQMRAASQMSNTIGPRRRGQRSSSQDSGPFIFPGGSGGWSGGSGGGGGGGFSGGGGDFGGGGASGDW